MPLSTRPSIIRDHCPCSRGVEEPMKRFVARRVGYALPSLVMLSATIFALLGLSVPPFWVGLLLILFFSVYLGWLPSSGSGTPWHVLMPAFALGWYFAAAHMRLTRSSMLEVLGSEYIKLARLKGLPETFVICKHAFKNALIPVLTLAG